MKFRFAKNCLLIFALLYCSTSWTQASQSLPDVFGDPDVRFLNQLAVVHDSNAAQQKIRFYVKGYREKMLDLFPKTANPQTKIYIANAYTIHGWAKDHHKNFNTIPSYNLLESFAIASQSKNCLRYILTVLYQPIDWDNLEFLTLKILGDALTLNTPFSVLLNALHYKVGPLGFLQAARLRPYIDLCYPEITYYYGQSLFRSSPGGSALFNEGLYYMCHSGLLEYIHIKRSLKHYSTAESYWYPFQMPVQGQPRTDIRFSIINLCAQPAQFIRLRTILAKPIPLSHVDNFRCCDGQNLHWISKTFKQKRLSGRCAYEGNIYKFKLYKKTIRSGNLRHVGTVSINTNIYHNNRFQLCESFRSNNYIYQLMINFFEDFLTRSGSPQSLANLFHTTNAFKMRYAEYL